jgi:hypothetical protein
VTEVVAEQTQQTQQTDASPEDRLALAAGLNPDPNAPNESTEKPRDDKGRFAKSETDPAQTEQAAETEQEAAAEEQPEYKWDEVKGIKLKIPMKNGDKEWEDEISLEELRNQRMMHADYMARRREWDEKEKTYSTQIRESVEKERNQYLGALNVLQESVMQVAASELASVDWQKLAAEDPAKYVQLSARAQMLGSTLQRIAAEHEKVQKQQENERIERISKAVEESRTKVKDAIPSWSDELYSGLLKRAEDYGLKREEIGLVNDPSKIQPLYAYDPRFIKILHDAHQFRMISEGKTAVEKKVANAAPVLKPGAVKPKVNQQVQHLQKAKERIKADPRSDDAATDLMRAFIR